MKIPAVTLRKCVINRRLVFRDSPVRVTASNFLEGYRSGLLDFDFGSPIGGFVGLLEIMIFEDGDEDAGLVLQILRRHLNDLGLELPEADGSLINEGAFA